MIIGAIVLLLVMGIVAFLNTEMVMIDLYLTSFNIPLWLVMAGTLLIGMVIAGLLASAVIARNRQALEDKDKELDRVESERKESVDKVKQDAETRIELQKKEAEIQRLNAKLASNQNTNRDEPLKDTRVEVPEEKHTKVEVRDEKQQGRTRIRPK